MKKRILSTLLAILMVAGMIPGAAFAAGAATSGVLTSTESTSAADNGVALSKSVSYDPDTGKVTTVVETYTTGTVTLSNTTKPTDIVLVLDVSGSMDFSFSGSDNNSGERMAAMKAAIDSFIDQTAQQNASITDADDKHSIAIVKFAADSYYPNATALTPGDHMSSGENYTEVLAGFTTADATGAASLKSSVDALKAGGATAVDYGLTLAANLLTARSTAENGKYADREKVVIVFTDGDPTHSSNYDSQVAYLAVNAAEAIKSAGAKIYTIGIFNGANVSGTDNSNVFMNYVSSNYPQAYGTAETEWAFIFPYTVYEIHPGAEPHHTGYYMTAANSSSLNNIFSTISSQIGKPDIELGASATLVDVVSDYFTIDGIGTNPTITVQTAAYKGNNVWDTPAVDTNVKYTVNGTDTISVTGFDFDANYISETARDNFYGKKLILTFVSTPNYDVIDAAGTFANGQIPTNDTAAILDSTGTAVEYVTSPKLTANTVTYQVTDSTTRTVASFYRFPGAAMTLLAKPTDTAEYSYSEWAATGVTLSGTSFTMPANDVILTSVGTTKTYNISYTYTGNVPANANPATAPAAATKAVGDPVTQPTVEAPAGYVFSGWIEDGHDIAEGVTSFPMPAEDLHFTGHFIAQANSYVVEHYMMGQNPDYSDAEVHRNVYDGVKTGDSVKATIPGHTGFTYDVVTTTANNASMDHTGTQPVPAGTVLANGGLVLKIYYKRNQHTVTYQYDMPAGTTLPSGVNPSDLSTLTQTAYYGHTVTIAPDAIAPGYTFSGWRIYTGDTTITDNGTTKTMVMPDGDVVLHGSFTATGETPYYTEHYFEQLDGSFALDPTKTGTADGRIERKGKADTTAYAEPLSGAAIAGFAYDPNNANNVVSGPITATEPYLTLKLYYTRARHTVTYQYTGTVPTDADPTAAELLAAPYTKTYMYGETVTIQLPASATGYSFHGWNITGGGITEQNNNGVRTFTMPARDVVLTGHFNPISAKYTVEHWLEDVNGTYTFKESTEEFSTNVFVGNNVTGVPKEYNTYTYNPTETAAMNTNMTPISGVSVPTGTVTADGGLVLKLLYSRKTYGITYRFEGTVPTGVTTPDGATLHGQVKHGVTVQLANITVPAGYTFDGWYHGTTLVSNSLVMPRENVELVGRFTANQNVPYTVRYHLQNTDGTTYTEDSFYTRTGTTGAYVVADTKDYPGFSFDTKKSTWNGHIKGDGTLELNLYYNRNSYTVSYYYFGKLPTDTTISMDGTNLTLANPVQPNLYLIVTENVLYGTPLTVKSPLVSSAAKYEFRGWYTANLNGVSSTTELASGTAYTMPAHNVEFRGALLNYTVYYNLDGGTLNNQTTVAPKEVNWNDAGLLPAGTPQKSGKFFSGWQLEGKENFVSATDKYSDLAAGPHIETITLKAIYADGYTVTYNWGTENIPPNVTLPTDGKLYAKGDSCTVHPAYTAGMTVENKNGFGQVIGHWTFSGWDKTGTFTVNSSVTITGSWSYKQVDNPPMPPISFNGSAELTKVDAADHNTVLAGVVFELHRENGTLVGTYTTDANGKIRVNNLPAGNYYWVETRAAEGYVLDNTKHAFAVSMLKNTPVVIANTKSNVPSVFGDDHYAYIIGYEDGLVHPEASITRAEVATIFFRLLSPATRSQYMTRENNFVDVNEGDWYNTAVSTMTAMGIFTGRPGNVFDPNAYITRAEFAAVAARFDTTGNTTNASFADIYEHWAQKEINIAANNGWVLGYEDGSFKPDQEITRAEAMTMVNRVLQRIPETPADLLSDMVVWPDNMDTSKWYYLMVQEATNSHYYARKASGYEYWIDLREVPDWTVYEK